jgi:UDP-N-acetylmuramoyl-L-alanyl-D-glutamate--2,6-diaminopimelate ligase
MIKLRELLAQISAVAKLPDHPALNQEIKSISTNSHACKPGSLFLGMPGTRVDGGEFWPSAMESGAITF